MKIKRQTLTESVKLVEEENLNPVEGSVETAAAEITAGAKEAGVTVSPETAKKEAEHAKKEAEAFKLNPYASSAKLSEVEEKLQACLEAAVKDKANGLDADYPDMLIYGLAGFGKTAGVKKFCKDHNIYMLPLDAKTLRPENLAGLPKAMTDTDGGEFQGALAQPVWKQLKEHEAVILVIDEVNRAKPNITGTLLGLICDHNLPIPHKNADGSWENDTHFENILFTVSMINPASRDLFQDVNELDPAMVNRFAFTHGAEANKREFLRVIKDIYQAVLANPFLVQEDKNRYQGQLDIAEALLTSPNFKFDDRDKAVMAHKAQRTEFRPRDALSYRSFVKVLRACDGTMNDYIKKVKWHGFLPETEMTIINALKSMNYTDKISKGNSIFTTNTTPQQQAKSTKTATEIDKILKDFEDTM